MQNSTSLRFSALLLGAIFHHSANAACVVVAAQDANVRAADAVVKIQAKLPVRLPNCDKLKVESGRVSACYLMKNDQRTCVNLDTGAVLNLAATADVSSAEAFGNTLLAIAKGDAKTKFGQTRAMGQVPGMPYGMVFPDTDLTIPWPAAVLGDLRDFRLEVQDSPTSPTSAAVIQNGMVKFSPPLASGVRYRWRAENATGGLTGVFRTPSDWDVQRLAPNIKALRASALPAEAVALLVSELWIDEGYAYNAYLETARAGLKAAE